MMLVSILNWVFEVGLIGLVYVFWWKLDKTEGLLNQIKYLLELKDEMLGIQEDNIKTLEQHVELLHSHIEVREGDEN